MQSILTPLLLTSLLTSSLQAAPNYQDDVLSVFKQHCLSCHNADKKKAGLDLSSFNAIQVGSSGGAVVNAGLPDNSPLYMAVNHHEDYVAMPPNKPKLPDAQLMTIHAWIAAGLIESKGGKSLLRDVQFNVASGSAMRPEHPAVPVNLPVIPIPKVNAPLPISALASSPWSDVVAINGHEQVLLFSKNQSSAEADIETPTYEHIGTLPFPEGDVHDLRFSRNGEVLIAAGGRGADTGKVVVYDVKTGKIQATIGDEYDIVLSADISSDHKYVVIGTPAKLVKIYSTANGMLLHRIEKHTDWVTMVRFNPDGKLLATGDRNGGIHVWETETGGIVYTLDEHKVKINALSWRSDGNILASAAEDGKFVLWDMKDGFATRMASAHEAKLQNRYTHTTGVLDLTFLQDGRLLTTGRDRAIRLWNNDGTKSKQVTGLKSLPLSVSTSTDDIHTFVGGFDGELQVWKLDDMSHIQTLKIQ